mmetsp:Transcript_76223/g.120335  ORF Transcript_76223/g.120335 Transcript_76223/m.120335 type:complete len:88 (+) Transcript_76223:2-265(+)
MTSLPTPPPPPTKTTTALADHKMSPASVPPQPPALIKTATPITDPYFTENEADKLRMPPPPKKKLSEKQLEALSDQDLMKLWSNVMA